MKLLALCSLFPPYVLGGAEISCAALYRWFAGQGHEVAVLTTAAQPDQEVHGELIDGIRIWRLWWPRPYSTYAFPGAPAWQKPVWHLQDHFDPRNCSMVRAVLAEFRPDLVCIHLIQGIGHNALSVLNAAGLPVIYFLHDLGLACLRASMYRKHKNCAAQCGLCRIASAKKLSYIRERPERYFFVSPSKANWQTVKKFCRLGGFGSLILPNLDFATPRAREPAPADGRLRLIFVGRLHPTKGIDFLLGVLAGIAARETALQLTVVGTGPMEPALRAKYKGCAWADFTGKVPPDQVGRYLSRADVLCVPSVWRENHPGVVRQGLRAGVPALVSGIGGTPEMVEPGVSGLVLPVRDPGAWRLAVETLMSSPSLVATLQDGARSAGYRYDAERLGRQFETLARRWSAVANASAGGF